MVHRPRAQFYVCFDSPSRSIVLFSALIVAIVNGRGAPASKASGTLTLRGRSTMMRSPSALQDFVATGFSRCCMKLSKVAAPAIVGLLAVNLAHAKPKKADVPAAFQNARYVYVQAEDGDILNPRLLPEDRQSISDVEDKVREWHRYAITINRSEADLVFVVRRAGWREPNCTVAFLAARIRSQVNPVLSLRREPARRSAPKLARAGKSVRQTTCSGSTCSVRGNLGRRS